MKKGIAVAGSILVDKINEIKAFPKSGELTQIQNLSQAVGGCVPNVAVDLKVIDKNIDIYALGKIGSDDEGKFVISELKKYGVDVSKIVYSKDRTSFTDVMSILGGERTFFTYPGASADFGLDDIDFKSLNVDMLHLGYFLLLEKVDNGDGLKILKKAKEKGIKTSIDLVSENSLRYKNVLPCLEYTDNLIINEIEGGNLAGIEPKRENLKKICEKLKSLGVRERVIIHMPEVGVCLSDNGYVEVPSFDFPKGYIKGTTGAGDAFCAGSLIGIYEKMSDKEILEFGSSCATMALSKPDAVSGMKEKAEILKVKDLFKRRTL